MNRGKTSKQQSIKEEKKQVERTASSESKNANLKHSGCSKCEERSEKIIAILSAKDAEIATLRQKLNVYIESNSVDEYVDTILQRSNEELQAAKSDLEKERAEHTETLSALQSTQDAYEQLRQQYNKATEKLMDQDEYLQLLVDEKAAAVPREPLQTPPRVGDTNDPLNQAAPPLQASAPVHVDSVESSDSSHALLQFYADRAAAAEEVSDVLRGELEDARTAIDAMNAEAIQSDARLRETNDKYLALRNEIESMQRELLSSESRFKEANGVIDDLNVRLADYLAIENTRKANDWWICVWNEYRNRSNNNESGSQVNIKELVDVVRISQNLIRKEHEWKKEKDDLLGRLRDAEKESRRLQSTVRERRFEESIIVEELTETLSAVKGNSDLYSQLAISRQEVANIRLLNMQLESDTEALSDILDTLRKDLTQARRDLDEAQSRIDKQSILDTINIPGVPIQSLIEVFAGKISSLEDDLALARSQKMKSTDTHTLLFTDSAHFETNPVQYLTEVKYKTIMHLLQSRVSALQDEVIELNEKVTSATYEGFEDQQRELHACQMRLQLYEADLHEAQTENLTLKRRLDSVMEKLALSEIDSKIREADVSVQVVDVDRGMPLRESKMDGLLETCRQELQAKLFEVQVLKEALAVLQDNLSPNKENSIQFMNKSNKLDKRIGVENAYTVSLANKVVELSEEISHCNSMRSFAETRLTKLEDENSASNKFIKQLQIDLRSTSEALNQQRQLSTLFSDQLKDILRNRVVEKISYDETTDTLQKSLKQLELKCNTQDILINQLRSQVHQTNGEEVMNILSNIIPEDDYNYGKSSGCSGVPKLITEVMTALEQLVKETEGKSHEKIAAFLKMLTSSISALELQYLEDEKLRLSSTMMNKKLRSIIRYMYIYKKRSESLCDLFAVQDRERAARLSTTVIYYKNSLEKAANELIESKKLVFHLKDCYHSAQNERDMLKVIEMKLMTRISEFDEKSQNSHITTKEECLQKMLEFVKTLEDSMDAWKSKQLPAIITSFLPLNEDINRNNCEVDITDPSSGNLGGNSSLAKAYAVSKLKINELYLKLAVLSETNDVLQEKCSELAKREENLLHRIDNATRERLVAIQERNDKFVEGQVYDKWYMEELPKVDSKVAGLEEALQRSKADNKALHSNNFQMQILLSKFRADEKALEIEHRKEINKVMLQHQIKVSKLHREIAARRQVNKGDDVENSYDLGESITTKLKIPAIDHVGPFQSPIAETSANHPSDIESAESEVRVKSSGESALNFMREIGNSNKYSVISDSGEFSSKILMECFEEIANLHEAILIESFDISVIHGLTLSANHILKHLCRVTDEYRAAPILKTAGISYPIKTIRDISTSPIQAASETHEEDQVSVIPVDLDVINGMREKVNSFESIMIIKDEIQEELELLEEQREQMKLQNMKAAALVEDLKAERADMEYVVESLKSSYEGSLSKSHAALESQYTVSRNQIRKLEELLVKQQSQLISFGINYKNEFKLYQPKSKRSKEMHHLQVGPALRNRKLAILEELHTRHNYKAAPDNKIEYNDLYVSELEEEVLNLRVFLSAETQIREKLDREIREISDRMKFLEKENCGDSFESYDAIASCIESTDHLTFEEQNSILRKVSNKADAISILNIFRRKTAEANGLREIAKDEGSIYERDSECLQLRESLSIIQSKLNSFKDEVSRKDRFLGTLRMKLGQLDGERDRYEESLKLSNSKLQRLEKESIRKDAIIRSLKRKLEEADQVLESRVISTPLFQDLLKRLEASDVEKRRATELYKGFKSKYSLSEDENAKLRVEVERLRQLELKHDEMLASNRRKDLTTKSYKEMAEKCMIVGASLKKDFEKIAVEHSKDKLDFQRKYDHITAILKKKEIIIQRHEANEADFDAKLKCLVEKVDHLEISNSSLKAALTKAKRHINILSQKPYESNNESSTHKERSHVIFDASTIPTELASSLEDLSDVFNAINTGAASEREAHDNFTLNQGSEGQSTINLSPSKNEKSSSLKSLVRAALLSPTGR